MEQARERESESEPEHEIRNSSRHSGVWNEANKINTPPTAAPNAEIFFQTQYNDSDDGDYDDNDEKKNRRGKTQRGKNCDALETILRGDFAYNTLVTGNFCATQQEKNSFFLFFFAFLSLSCSCVFNLFFPTHSFHSIHV